MLLGSMVAAMAIGSHGIGFILVDHGTARSHISLRPDSPAVDRRAADILRDSIQQISGVDLPILTTPSKVSDNEIVIGASDAATQGTLRPDGFAVTVTTHSVRIVSGGQKGSIYGVIDLLEKRFGCRYFSPTVRLFPKSSTLTLPLGSTRDNPVNSFRAVNGDFANDPDWLDWQRLNSTAEVFGKGYYVHTFHKLVPPETYLKDHPEYFALINGRRAQEQLCPSRPENVEIAVETLKREMAAQPDKQIWSVSQNDNQEYCHCPECLKAIQEEGSPAGPVIRFVNAVAKHFPNKTISTLAYEYSRKAPRLTKPDPNVQVMLCTIELSRSAPIASDPTSAAFRKDIVDWGKICNNLYLWDYTVDFAHQIAPFPNLSVLQPNIQFFAENHAHQHFQQTNTSVGHEFSELKSYLIARLLWNPDINVEATVQEFLRGFYGAAGPAVRRYIAALDDRLHRSGTRLDIFGRPNAHDHDFLSPDAILQYDGLFDQAEHMVATDPVLTQRVKVARLPVQYAKITIAADDIFGPRGFFEDNKGKPVPRAENITALDEFAKTCQANKIRSVNEANVSPSEFVAAIRGLLDLQMDGNLAFRKAVTAIPAPSPKYGHSDVRLLTNGVRGSTDFGVQWLGWEGLDFDVTLDLGSEKATHEAVVDSLYAQQSWILHPKSITCSISSDGTHYRKVGTSVVVGDQRKEPLLRAFSFSWPSEPARFIRLHVEGTKILPTWHAGAGGKAWVFLDEIVVH